MIRLPKCLLAGLALVLVVALTAPVLAADATKGTIKSINADQRQFTLTDVNGKDWPFGLSESAEVLLNDKAGRLQDLKEGNQVTVTYNKIGDRLIASKVEFGGQSGQARQDQDRTQVTQFRDLRNEPRIMGRVTRVEADKHQFILTDKDGKEWTFTLTERGRLRVADKVSPLGDLKPGTTVYVAPEKRGEGYFATSVTTSEQQGLVTKGQIKSVTTNRNQFVLTSTDGKDYLFTLADGGKIYRNDQESKLSNLGAGDIVMVTYDVINNGLYATDINVNNK